MTLTKKVRKNLLESIDLSLPLLIGVSGGPDSIALLHLLEEIPLLSIAIAHVDHGWRPESGQEADALRTLAAKKGVPFHLKRLDVGSVTVNLEEYCRLQRLAFFKELCQEYGYQAVALGHHADDQVETVLKRVMEGSALCHFGAMKRISMIDGLKIFRPLLDVSRKDILHFIEEKKISSFEDHTNYDTKFLRARLRQETFPFLTKQFGKNVRTSLLRLSKEAQELEHYLDRKITTYLSGMVEGPWGTFIDLSQHFPVEELERQHLLKHLCKNYLTLSREQYTSLSTHLLTGTADRHVATGKGIVFIDRRRLFILKKKILPLKTSLPLTPGIQSYGPWTVTVKHLDAKCTEAPPHSSWKNLWQGPVSIVLPQGNYQLGPCASNECYPRTHTISKWWTSHKVPAFLRPLVPVVRDEAGICHEFLVGKSEKNLLNIHNLLISIELTPFYIS